MKRCLLKTVILLSELGGIGMVISKRLVLIMTILKGDTYKSGEKTVQVNELRSQVLSRHSIS